MSYATLRYWKKSLNSFGRPKPFDDFPVTECCVIKYDLLLFYTDKRFRDHRTPVTSTAPFIWSCCNRRWKGCRWLPIEFSLNIWFASPYCRYSLSQYILDTSNGSWCIGIKGEMSGTVCVTFTWVCVYIWVVYSFCLFCCLFIIVTWWYMWCIVWQVAIKKKYRHVW